MAKQITITIAAICFLAQPLFPSNPAFMYYDNNRFDIKDPSIFQFFFLTSQHRSYNLSLNSLSLNKGAAMGLKDELGLRKGFKNSA